MSGLNQEGLKRVLLLGTGTDVGKTYVGKSLLQAWQKNRGPTLALKPIESGITISADTAQACLSSDAGTLQAAANVGSAPLYSFRDPVSPHLAAEREKVTIELGRIVRWVDEKEEQFLRSELLNYPEQVALSLVETAGGAFSPLSLASVNADLARALDPALWILVAPDAVGVLHDVSATLCALHCKYARAPDLVILSGAREVDATTNTNAAELERVVFEQLQQAAPRCRKVATLVRNGNGEEISELVASLL